MRKRSSSYAQFQLHVESSNNGGELGANLEPAGEIVEAPHLLFGAGTVALSVCLSISGHVECLLFVYISLNMPSGKFVSKMHTTNTYKQISIKHANADSAEK